jgi:hypothetical protein
VSVTISYYRVGDAPLEHLRRTGEWFRFEDHPDTENLQTYGEECMLVGDLITEATTGLAESKLVSGAVSGFAGVSLFDNDDFPYLIDPGTVAHASRLLEQLSPEDLRRLCDLGRLKARYLEVEEWLWEDWGPNVLDRLLLPRFELIRGLYRRAVDRKQHMIVSWF